MSYRSIFVGPLFESRIEERAPAESLMSYALELAAIGNAHLSIGVGSCKFSVPAAAVVREARDLISAANKERHEHAETFGANLLTRARAAGVIASVEIVHDVFSEVAMRLVRMARVADIAILQPSDETLSLMQGVVEDVLFQSGRPVIIVPATWNKPASLETIIVSWDGSAKAARAIGDALPLLKQAGRVEIVSITGDPDSTKRIEGAEIATHLARYCRSVSVTTLTSQDGNVGATLSSHATNTRASMIVMGAYAHNRLRQFVLGGVTNTMITDPPVPVLMSY
jgi:nucleotide-binding universal stress UspA family protein